RPVVAACTLELTTGCIEAEEPAHSTRKERGWTFGCSQRFEDATRWGVTSSRIAPCVGVRTMMVKPKRRPAGLLLEGCHTVIRCRDRLSSSKPINHLSRRLHAKR